MSKRTRHKTKGKKSVYAVRNAKGEFQDIQNIGKSVKADRKRTAKNRPKKKGQGHLGDYSAAPKKKSKCSCKKKKGWLARLFS